MPPIEPLPFVLPRNRERITGEPGRVASQWTPEYPDVGWVGENDQGGGVVPSDFAWRSNPKQEQDRLSSG